MIELPVNFGILGCGMIANYHAQAIRAIPEASLRSIYDTNQQSARAFAQRYGVQNVASLEAFLEDERLDVVCICTPSGLHKELALQAIAHGKHVIIEKPMALTPEACDEIIQACRVHHVHVAVISQLRFSPAVTALKEAIEAGALGTLITGDVFMKFHRAPEYYQQSPWRGTWKMDGGGALMNQGIHGVDLLQYLMGAVASVYANAKTLVHSIEVEDTACALVSFQNGAMGIIQGTTAVQPGYPRRIEICGSCGSAILVEDQVEAWDIPGYPRPATTETNHIRTFNDPSAMDFAGHKKQIQDLISALSDGRAPVVDQYEGKKPVEIICAIYQSARTRRPVEL